MSGERYVVDGRVCMWSLSSGGGLSTIENRVDFLVGAVGDAVNPGGTNCFAKRLTVSSVRERDRVSGISCDGYGRVGESASEVRGCAFGKNSGPCERALTGEVCDLCATSGGTYSLMENCTLPRTWPCVQREGQVVRTPPVDVGVNDMVIRTATTCAICDSRVPQPCGSGYATSS